MSSNHYTINLQQMKLC